MRVWQSGSFLAALALVASVSVASAQAARPPAPRMPHAPAGKENCLTCHAVGANEHISDVPAGHPTSTRGCTMCHRAAETMPATTPHALTGDHANCVSCHARGSSGNAPKQPEAHPQYHASVCATCHVARAG